MKNHASLGAADAQLAIQVIQSELARRGESAVIAVADDHGELVGLLRGDGAPLPSIVIATNKAWTAARERKPSFELGQASRDPQKGFDMAYYGDPRYIGWGGGVPVVVAGTVVGSIAVSGLSQEEDMELAGLGAAAIVEAVVIAPA
ncbi:MAG TPA: heme-binding protein [Candidatus Limnocylindrales bacterium]